MVVKLKTNQSYRFGQKNIIPYAGEVEISNEGIIEVSEEIAHKVVGSNCGFNFLLEEKVEEKKEDDVIEKVEKNDFNENQNNDLEKVENDSFQPELEEEDEEEEMDIEKIREELKSKTVEELKTVARDSGLNEEEFKGKKKDELIDFLIEKIKE